MSTSKSEQDSAIQGGDREQGPVIPTQTKKLSKIRGGHKASVTRALRAVDKIILAYNDEEKPTLLGLKMTLERKLDTLLEIHEKILDELENEDEITEEILESDDLQLGIQSKIMEIDEFLKKSYDDNFDRKNFGPKTVPVSNPTNTNVSSHTVTEQGPVLSSFQPINMPTCPPMVVPTIPYPNSVPNPEQMRVPDPFQGNVPLSPFGTNFNLNVRLPKLEIKKFGGNPREYRSFESAFRVTIHDNNCLSEVEKFTYLKSYLTGEAEMIIKGLDATAENYIEALKLLDERYGNRQVIVNSHMEAFFKLPNINDSNNIRLLRKLYDQMEVNLRSLKALGVPAVSFGCMLIPIILDKLPKTLNLHLSRKFREKENIWDIDLVMNELREELEARERCQWNVERKPDEQFKGAKSSAGALLVEDQYKNCAYCDGRHYSDQCRIVTDLTKRREILRTERRCFLCTRKNHMIKNCKSKGRCYKCKGNHHTSICERNNRENENEEPKKRENDETPQTKSTAAISSGKTIMLQTAQLDVSSSKPSGKGVSCKVIFDSGSQRSYVTRKLATEVGAVVDHKEKLVIGGFGGEKTKEKLYNVVDIVLDKRGCQPIQISAVVVDTICSPLSRNCPQDGLSNFLHLKGLPLADEVIEEESPDVCVLIGLDFYYDIITGEVIRGTRGPFAIGSIFGYILSGVIEDKSIPSKHSNFISHMLRANVTNKEVYDEVKKFWEIEALGINEESDVDEMFKVNLEKRPDRYYVNLPWKEVHKPLCDNYEMANKRLSNNLKKLRKNIDLQKNYEEIINDQESAGIIEEIKNEGKSVVGKTYYMPHHAVIRQDKSTSKVRIVYDASSKYGGASLNECLHGGTTLFTDLFAVLLRFRLYRVALIGDIQQAFLSIGIKEEDRDALRFLWVKNINDEKPQIRHMRFTRVCFGIISSMAHLDFTIRHHLDTFGEKYHDTIDRIRNSLYVDDLTGGHESREQAWAFYKEAKYIFKEAAMNLRKWKTNDEELKEKIITEEQELNENFEIRNSDSHASETLNPKVKTDTKVLGVPWDVDDDSLKFNLHMLEGIEEKKITKRMLLRAVASVFDPMGVLSPIVIKLKILFQEVCKKHIDWDEFLCKEHQEMWDALMDDIRLFEDIELPRCVIEGRMQSIDLVGFSDASEKAYAACIFIVSENDGKLNSHLLASKTRIAPLKALTMPRLELMAALILSRLMNRVVVELRKICSIGRIVCLTDAAIVLAWVRGEDKQYKTFVQNRLLEIRRNVDCSNWFHVPGKENIADLPSRGCLATHLLVTEVKEIWTKGPCWLRSNFEDWPITKKIRLEEPEDLELKENSCKSSTCFVAKNLGIKNLSAIITPESYSSSERLFRITAWCLRFVNNCRKSKVKQCGELNAEEYKFATELWIKQMQSELKSELYYEKKCRSLGIYEDENEILRCRGRIGKAKIQFDTRFPIIIPTHHYITKLIILEAHEGVYHNGVKETLAKLRSKFWIVKGRQKVKEILRRCHICKVLEGLAYPAPITCDLPEFRVEARRVFETAGVDFCGPVYIKPMYTKNYQMNKAYIALTTCASSRMVHLELTPDLSTMSYVKAQKRFIARRGYPSMMVSDNGKTFKGNELKAFNAKHGIKWRFNLPKSPWWGGMFERLVRSVKRCLKKTLGKGRLTYEEFLTVLVEIEAVINNRPLTYIDEDDLEQPLTPSHLFCGRRTIDKPETIRKAHVELTKKEAVRRNKYLNVIVEKFWKRWKDEYLVELRQNHKMRVKPGPLKINKGDVVLIHDENKRRMEWKLGKIEELVIGGDNVVRGAVLRVRNENGVGSIQRPIQRLFPLEVTDAAQEFVQESAVDNIIEAEADFADEDSGKNHDLNNVINDKCSGSLGTRNKLGGSTSQKLEKKENNTRSRRKAATSGEQRRRNLQS